MAKVLWLLFVIVTPYLGVFVYLVVRGNAMAERQMAAAQHDEAAVREYIQSAAGGGRPVPRRSSPASPSSRSGA